MMTLAKPDDRISHQTEMDGLADYVRLKGPGTDIVRADRHA